MATSLNEYLAAKHNPNPADNVFPAENSASTPSPIVRRSSSRRKAPSPMMAAHDLITNGTGSLRGGRSGASTPAAAIFSGNTMGTIGISPIRAGVRRESSSGSVNNIADNYSDEDDLESSYLKNNNWFTARQQITEIAREGWVWRKGTLGGWKRYYAIARHQDAKAGVIYLFKDFNDKFPHRTIPLTECLDVRLKDIKAGSQRFEFKLLLRKSDITFACDAFEDAAEWVKLLDALIPKIAEPAFERLESELIHKDRELNTLSHERGELETEIKLLRDTVDALRKKERDIDREMRTSQIRATQDSQNMSSEIAYLKRELADAQSKNMELQKTLTNELSKGHGQRQESENELHKFIGDVLSEVEKQAKSMDVLEDGSRSRHEIVTENIKGVEGRVKWLQQRMTEMSYLFQNQPQMEGIKQLLSDIINNVTKTDQNVTNVINEKYSMIERKLRELHASLDIAESKRPDFGALERQLGDLKTSLQNSLDSNATTTHNAVHEAAKNTTTAVTGLMQDIQSSLQDLGINLDKTSATQTTTVVSSLKDVFSDAVNQIHTKLNEEMAVTHKESEKQGEDMKRWFADLQFEVKTALTKQSEETQNNNMIKDTVQRILDKINEKISKEEKQNEEQAEVMKRWMADLQFEIKAALKNRSGNEVSEVSDMLNAKIDELKHHLVSEMSKNGSQDHVPSNSLNKLSKEVEEINRKLALGLFGTSNDNGMGNDSERSLRTLITSLESRLSSHSVESAQNNDITHKSTRQIYDLLQHLQKTVLESINSDRPGSPTKRKLERQVEHVEGLSVAMMECLNEIKNGMDGKEKEEQERVMNELRGLITSKLDETNARVQNDLQTVVKSEIEPRISELSQQLSSLLQNVQSSVEDKSFLRDLESRIQSTIQSTMYATSNPFDETSNQISALKSNIQELAELIRTHSQQTNTSSAPTHPEITDNLGKLTSLTEDLCRKERITSAALDGIQHSLSHVVNEIMKGNLLAPAPSKEVVDVSGMEELKTMIEKLMNLNVDTSERQQQEKKLDDSLKTEVSQLSQQLTTFEDRLQSRASELKSQVQELTMKKHQLMDEVQRLEEQVQQLHLEREVETDKLRILRAQMQKMDSAVDIHRPVDVSQQ